MMNIYSTCSPHTSSLPCRTAACEQSSGTTEPTTIIPTNNDENNTTTKNTSDKFDCSRTSIADSTSTNASNNFLLDNVSIHKDNFMSSPGSKDSLGNKPSNNSKSSSRNHLVTSDTRRSHHRSKTLDFEPKSISYLHQKRFSESENNPFLLSKNLENTTSNNTELNKRLSLSDLVNNDEANSSAVLNSTLSNSPKKFSAGTSSSTITEDGASINSDSTSVDLGFNTPPRNLIRKKTGEIVKSSLKLSSLANMGTFERSSQSLPTTPTYKSVHFNNKSFADVKYFNEKDTPEAISTEVTPLQSYKKMSSRKIASRNKNKSFNWLIGDSGSEDSGSDFSDDDVDAYNDDDIDDGEPDSYSNYRSSIEKADWCLECSNFNDNGIYDFKVKENLPVFVERFFLTTDKKFFKGYIAVKNLSFEKKVTFKYSLNNWRIISEIDAIFVSDVPRILRKHNYDRFAIKIPISALVTDNNSNSSSGRNFNRSNKERVSLVAVIRYTAAGRDYWDNNYSKNYEMVFKNENYSKFNTQDNDDEDEYYFSEKKDKGITNKNKKKIKNAGLANNFNFSDDDIYTDDTLTFNDKHEEYFPTIRTLSPIGINLKNNNLTDANSKVSDNVNPIGNGKNGSIDLDKEVNTNMANIDLTSPNCGEKATNRLLKNPQQKYNKFELGESLLETPEIKSPTSLFYSAGVNAASTAESLVFGGKPSSPSNDIANLSSSPGVVNANKNMYSPVSPARLLNMEKDSLIDRTKPILSPERALKLSENTKKKKMNNDFNLTNEIEKLRQSQHSTDSSDYQKLVQSYCFFQG